MGIVLIITAIVLALSLYEYLSTRSWQQITSVTRNNLVFDGRNKAYGAYKLREDYNKRFVFILLGALLSVGVIQGVRMIVKAMPTEEIAEEEVLIEIEEIFDEPAEEEEEIAPPPPVEDAPPPMEVSVQFIPPVVVDREVKNDPPVQDQLDNTKAAAITNTTGINDAFVAPPTTDIRPTVTANPAPEIETFVDEEAVFPGGIAAMRKFIASKLNYPQIAVEQGIEGKCFLKFVIETDGSIGKVEIVRAIKGCPECGTESIRVVKSMPKWTPGKKNGKAVRSYYQIPITFELRS